MSVSLPSADASNTSTASRLPTPLNHPPSINKLAFETNVLSHACSRFVSALMPMARPPCEYFGYLKIARRSIPSPRPHPPSETNVLASTMVSTVSFESVDALTVQFRTPSAIIFETNVLHCTCPPIQSRGLLIEYLRPFDELGLIGLATQLRSSSSSRSLSRPTSFTEPVYGDLLQISVDDRLLAPRDQRPLVHIYDR